MKAAIKKLTPFISILFFSLAVWFLDQELRQYSVEDVVTQLSAIPNIYILFSLILSFLSYLVLTAYDGLGVSYIGEKLAPGKIIRAGYIGYAFSHNIGLALITGGSIRYRIYSAWGFSAIQVTQIVAFSALTLWIGFCSVAGLSLIFATPDFPAGEVVPFVSLRILGAVLLAMVIAYLVASKMVRKEFSVKGWTFSLPELQTAVKQVVIASIDWLMAASVLYVLLPDIGINFFSFTGVFLLAQIAGLFSQVPGGLGVFESVMLLYLSNFMDGSAILGTLVVYRIIYYIIPLIGAMLILGYQEYRSNRKVVREFGQKAMNWFPRVVPHVLSISVFIGGAVLLFSGSMPSDVPRMQWLQHFIPLPVMEMSHFLASLVGAALMVLAHSLQRRIDMAYMLTMGLLVFGILFSLLKGADYEEAIFLSLMLLALIPCKQEFHRKASLFSRQFSTGWLSMIIIVIFSSIWLGTFSFRNVEYQSELWWQFTLLGDAPRYLRATVGVLGFTVIIGLVKLLKPKKQQAEEPEHHDIERATDILRFSPHSRSNAVLARNKELLFNNSRNAFIMYGIEGKSWISLGDPVGPDSEAENLVWKFKESCELHGSHPVFYQVQEKYLSLYIDLGLSWIKIGEEARVPLQTFDIENKKFGSLKESHRLLADSGYSFSLIPPEELDAYFEQMENVSESWLEKTRAADTGFAHGRFDQAYLSYFPTAVVIYKGKIVAFSNLWTTAGREELSFDLLRNFAGAPDELIDYLLVEIMLWGREEGYRWFNLGLAPLSGMNGRQPYRWGKFADFIYSYGENFYSFKEARRYRERFEPVWESRYLVSPGGWALPGILSNLTSLVSGGVKSLIN